MIVSVVISTYNSSQFIEETFDSIKAQSWPEIELIITDDCSADNTIELCQNWLKENGHRFIRTVLLTSSKNTGVSANGNRGLRAAHGEWIKFLGADDTLLPESISDNMIYLSEHQEIKVLFSKVNVYHNTFEEKNLKQTIPGSKITEENILWPGRSAISQYKMLLICDRIHFSPSVMIQRETMLSVGVFDERFPMMEDYPLWLKLTKSGHRLFFMDKLTVNYRQHSGAINNNGNEYLLKPNYFRTEVFRQIYTYPNLPWDIRMKSKWAWYASQPFRSEWLNRNTKPNKLLLAFLTIWINPFKYVASLKKWMVKGHRNDELYN